eukprot:g4300.t1
MLKTFFSRTLATSTKHGGSGSHSKGYIKKRMVPYWVRAKKEELQKSWEANPRPLTYTREMKEAGEVPFSVKRTELAGELPVYKDYKNGRMKTVTILRKYDGDVHALASEFQKVCKEAEVKIYNGRIEGKGNHVREVKQWLGGLGF